MKPRPYLRLAPAAPEPPRLDVRIAVDDHPQLYGRSRTFRLRRAELYELLSMAMRLESRL